MGENTTDSPSGMMQAFSPKMGWKDASVEWGLYWTGFKMTATVLNALLIIWTISNLIFIFVKGRSLVSRKYFITLNLMVLTFAITKLLFYAIDPKGIKELMPELAGNLLNNSSFPALTVGFCMLYVALSQCTIPNRHLLPLILKSKSIIAFVIICFFLSYLTDIAVVYSHSMQLMIILCQVFYIIWGFVFFSLYIALVIKYRTVVQKSRKKMEKTCYRRGHCRRDFNKRNLKDIPVCVKISCATAIFFLVLSCLNIYLVLIEIGLLLKRSAVMNNMCNRHQSLWPFYSFNLILMIVEHLMAIALAVAGTQPLKWLRLSPLLASASRSQMTVSSSVANMEPNIFTIERDMETSFTDVTTTASVSLHTYIPSATSTDSTAAATGGATSLSKDSNLTLSADLSTSHSPSASVKILSMNYFCDDKIT